MSTAKNTDQRGSTLVTTLIVLLILTALGMACLEVADMNTLISANDRESKATFFHADSGVNIGHTFLEAALDSGNTTFYNSTASDWSNSSLDEFNSTEYPLSEYVNGSQGTYIRSGLIKRGTLKGTAIQIGTGYEGVGKSAAHEGTYATYLVRAHREGKRNSRAEVDIGWRHINN